MAEKCLIYPCDIPDTSVRNALNRLEMCLKNIEDICYFKDMFYICSIYGSDKADIRLRNA